MRTMQSIFIAGVFFLSIGQLLSQTAIDKALEDFALSVTDNFQTSNTTAESIDADLQYFELDIDGDGNDEIFVSRSDLSRDDNWMLYRRLDGSDSEIKNLGIATIHAPSIRSGEREGKKGYYESYHFYGNRTDRLIFNTFDDQGILVALMEETIDSGGKDKELWDSIYTDGSSAPEVKTTPVTPIRTRLNNMRNHEASNGIWRKATVGERYVADTGTGLKLKSAGRSVSPIERRNQAAGGNRLWIYLVFLAVILFLGWKYRNPKLKLMHSITANRH